MNGQLVIKRPDNSLILFGRVNFMTENILIRRPDGTCKEVTLTDKDVTGIRIGNSETFIFSLGTPQITVPVDKEQAAE